MVAASLETEKSTAAAAAAHVGILVRATPNFRIHTGNFSFRRLKA